MRYRQKRQEVVENLNLTPLIDVLFVLLIFFMVTTTFVKEMGLDINRPSAASATKASSKVIRVYVDKDSAIYIDNQLVQLWAMQSKLRDLLRDSSESSVLVIADNTIPVDVLINVVDECRMSGVKDVAVSTTKEMG